MDPQHLYARFEHKRKTAAAATRLCWISIDYEEDLINVGIQVKNEQDVKNLSILDLPKIVDNIHQDGVQSNILELIKVSDALYKHIADHYESHDIHIEVTNSNQPVLSTIYHFNNPPF